MQKTTEKESNYAHLDKMSTQELLVNINNEDKTVAFAVENSIDSIKNLVDAAYVNLSKGGRIFYLGSGTSGRLGIVDASECPPTFGVPFELVNGIIAGGDAAIRKAQEFAEDDPKQGWKDLEKEGINAADFVIGISASGSTPYVKGALEECNARGILTACICANTQSIIGEIAKYPVEVAVGPEFVTGSTRMKAGTAQKLVLNMISTSLMIKMGKVKGNKMVDMQLCNQKLIDRGTRMLVELYELAYEDAQKLLLENGSVRAVIKKMEA